MANQPGGFGILASGTYTQASSASSMTIPISYSGKPIFYVVNLKRTELPISATYSWILARYDLATTIYSNMYPYNTKFNENVYRGTVGNPSHQTNNVISASSSAITCKQRDANYPVISGDYEWEIWGVRQ